MDRNSHGLFLSVITVAEIEDGISRRRRTGARAKAARLAEWLDTLLHLHAARILPIDLAVARRIGILMDQARGQGHDPGLADVAIAATAASRGHTVLTRNLRHFAPLGVPALDPHEHLPAVPDTLTIVPLPAGGPGVAGRPFSRAAQMFSPGIGWIGSRGALPPDPAPVAHRAARTSR